MHELLIGEARIQHCLHHFPDHSVCHLLHIALRDLKVELSHRLASTASDSSFVSLLPLVGGGVALGGEVVLVVILVQRAVVAVVLNRVHRHTGIICESNPSSRGVSGGGSRGGAVGRSSGCGELGSLHASAEHHARNGLYGPTRSFCFGRRRFLYN